MSVGRQLISVHLPPRPYDIHVQPGILHDVGMLLTRLSPSPKACLVTDSVIAPLHAARLSESLSNAGINPITMVLPPGEGHKTIETVGHVYDAILRAGIDRHTPIIALGGGVIGDTAGFVAATILRGVPFVQVPTTLLAMVDASVGGKTGVNHAVGKNLIGAFHQPIAVLIDPEVLRTLPPRELRSGLAECIKHDLIRDAKGFDASEKDIGRALDLDMDYLTKLIAHNVAIKARVVEADPLERGERAHLNFGHTFGHAIETVSNYEYSHGESVALGMIAAAYTSREMKLIDENARQRIVSIIAGAGLPTGKMNLDINKIVAAMAFDKKVKSGKRSFVLLDGIGKATIRDDVSLDLVRSAVESLRE